jgi:hypothetical protein
VRSSVLNPPGNAECSGTGLIVAVTVLGEVSSELAGPVGGIGEHLNRGGLAGVQAGGGLSVADVAGSQLASGDQPGFGFDPNVSLNPSR